MPIRKREGSDAWYLDIRTPGGDRIRQTTGTTDRKEAQEYHDKLKHELWQVSKLGARPRRTFDDAAVRLLQECAGTTDYTNKCIHVRHWRQHFSGRYLDSLKRDEIFDALPQYNSRTKESRPLSSATKNLYLSTLRGMLNRAMHEWDWIDKAPKLSDLPGKPKRIRWITREEAQQLLGAIQADWLRDVATFALATGLRRANVLGLEWSQVDLVNRRAWIHPNQTTSEPMKAGCIWRRSWICTRVRSSAGPRDQRWPATWYCRLCWPQSGNANRVPALWCIRIRAVSSPAMTGSHS